MVVSSSRWDVAVGREFDFAANVYGVGGWSVEEVSETLKERHFQNGVC